MPTMSQSTALLLVLPLLAAVVDWWAVETDRPRVEEVAKPAVMVLLIGWVLAVPDADPTVRTWVVVALGLSLVGDVLLLPRLDVFVGGLAAFLLGHLAFVPALLPHADGLTGGFAALLVVPAAVFVGRRIADGARDHGGRPLAGAVGVYILAVGATALLAVASRAPLVMAGGLLFATSDGVLGWNRFVAPVPHGRTVVHVTYHLAQLGLASVVTLSTVA